MLTYFSAIEARSAEWEKYSPDILSLESSPSGPAVPLPDQMGYVAPPASSGSFLGAPPSWMYSKYLQKEGCNRRQLLTLNRKERQFNPEHLNWTPHPGRAKAATMKNAPLRFLSAVLFFLSSFFSLLAQ